MWRLTKCSQVPTCYFLVENFGFTGAPMAQFLLNWIILIALLALCKLRGLHAKCWGGYAGAAVLKDWRPMLKIGAAGVASNMGQWWSWEIAAGMAGTLGEVALAAHAVLQNIGFFLFPLFFGTSTGATVRTGQALGAGDGAAAQMMMKATLSLAGLLAAGSLSILLGFRQRFAYLYSDDAQVVALAAEILPIYLCYQGLTAANFALMGIMSGLGRQATTANVGMIAWYVVGLPAGALLCFKFELGLIGLWSGLTVGLLFSVITIATIVSRMDWHAQAVKARAKALTKQGAGEKVALVGDEGPVESGKAGKNGAEEDSVYQEQEV